MINNQLVLKNNQLVLIDNNFFKLSATQAKQLVCENILPKVGFERKANLDCLKSFELGRTENLNGFDGKKQFVVFPKSEITDAWIKRTPLSTAPNGWTWAVHIIFAISY